MYLKYSNKLTIQDFKEFPVWEFTSKHEDSGPDSELVVTPVLKLPVITLEGRSVGTEVRLANGDILVAVLTGVDLKKARPIPGAIFYRGEDKFLFRPSAPMVSGPDHLARFLGLAAKDVFPIIFDISKIAVGDPNAVKGEIPLDAPPSPRGKSILNNCSKRKTSCLKGANELNTPTMACMMGKKIKRRDGFLSISSA